MPQELLNLQKQWPILNIPLLLKTLSKIPVNNICPEKENVFKAFNLCNLNDCNIVFLGQDPYPQKGVATGILFGNSNYTPEEEISQSLKILKSAILSCESGIFDNSLEDWAKQGILMINSALTVETNKIGSHTLIWRPFISDFLSNLSSSKKHIIYVLFGQQAQSFIPYINKDFNYIFKEKHPAFYARTNESMSNKIFIDINNCLREQNKNIIEWCKTSN